MKQPENSEHGSDGRTPFRARSVWLILGTLMAVAVLTVPSVVIARFVGAALTSGSVKFKDLWTAPTDSDSLGYSMHASRRKAGFRTGVGALVTAWPDPVQPFRNPLVGSVHPDRVRLLALWSEFVPLDSQLPTYRVDPEWSAVGICADYAMPPRAGAPMRVRRILQLTEHGWSEYEQSGDEAKYETLRKSLVQHGLLIEAQRIPPASGGDSGKEDLPKPIYTPVAVLWCNDDGEDPYSYRLSIRIQHLAQLARDNCWQFRDVPDLVELIVRRQLPSGGVFRSLVLSYTGITQDEQTAAERCASMLHDILKTRIEWPADSLGDRAVAVASVPRRSDVLGSLTVFLREYIARQLTSPKPAPPFLVAEPTPSKYSLDPTAPSPSVLEDTWGVRIPGIVGGVDPTGWIQYLTMIFAVEAILLLLMDVFVRKRLNGALSQAAMALSSFFAGSLVLLGMFGTVLGIALAMDVARLLNSVDELIRVNANNRLFGLFAVAFFTTIVGLVWDRTVEFVKVVLRDGNVGEAPVEVRVTE